MVETDTKLPKLLFILSNDFGELGYALHFLRGGLFQPVLLLPDRLYAAHREGLPVLTCPYRSLSEILSAVAAEAPDVVFLCSGYLYGVNALLTESAVEELLRRLYDRGCKVVTTDPFLGLWSSEGPSLVDDRHPLKETLTRHFSWISRVLTDVVHLYSVVPPDSIKVPWVSFSNKNIALRPGDWADVGEKLTTVSNLDPARRRWLFLLSQEDYGAQTALYGRARFDELFASKVGAALLAGRQPVVIAPPECLRSLAVAGLPPGGALLYATCPYALFMAFLCDAEFAFYWNVFSHSVPARGMNRLPFFFFDQGHLGRALPPFQSVGLQCYYGGAELPFLDPERVLKMHELTALAARQELMLEPARAAYSCSPSPVKVVERLLIS